MRTPSCYYQQISFIIDPSFTKVLRLSVNRVMFTWKVPPDEKSINQSERSTDSQRASDDGDRHSRWDFDEADVALPKSAVAIELTAKRRRRCAFERNHALGKAIHRPTEKWDHVAIAVPTGNEGNKA